MKKPEASKAKLTTIIPHKKTIDRTRVDRPVQQFSGLLLPKATAKADPTIAIAARFIRSPGKYPKPKPKSVSPNSRYLNVIIDT
ncbi:MAG: hypothetical protein ABI180_01530 [Microcoleus sp.]